MGDEAEPAGPVYVYEGARAEGATAVLTSGAKTAPVTLLGERHGEGVATYPQGDKFTGSFEDGARSGQGTYSYAAPLSGEEEEEPKPPLGEYAGAFQSGEKSGVGTMNYASGAKYQGAWKAGKFEGAGTMYYPNGDIYSGAWLAGQKHGNGTYFYQETSAKMEGTWEKNTFFNSK